jgi:hypothetical protein
MDKSNAVAPLAFPGDHPADILARVANVVAFLETAIDGDHIRPDGQLVLHPEARGGLAVLLGFIQQSSADAADRIGG